MYSCSPLTNKVTCEFRKYLVKIESSLPFVLKDEVPVAKRAFFFPIVMRNFMLLTLIIELNKKIHASR